MISLLKITNNSRWCITYYYVMLNCFYFDDVGSLRAVQEAIQYFMVLNKKDGTILHNVCTLTNVRMYIPRAK